MLSTDGRSMRVELWIKMSGTILYGNKKPCKPVLTNQSQVIYSRIAISSKGIEGNSSQWEVYREQAGWWNGRIPKIDEYQS